MSSLILLAQHCKSLRQANNDVNRICNQLLLCEVAETLHWFIVSYHSAQLLPDCLDFLPAAGSVQLLWLSQEYPHTAAQYSLQYHWCWLAHQATCKQNNSAKVNESGPLKMAFFSRMYPKRLECCHSRCQKHQRWPAIVGSMVIVVVLLKVICCLGGLI